MWHQAATLRPVARVIWLVARAARSGRLGTLLRTGDAVGAGGLILLDECADPFVEAVRASMGALFTQQVAQAKWDAFLPWLRAGDGQLVAASLRDAQPYRGAPYKAPCFILLGNESRGLPQAYEDACDLRGRPCRCTGAPTALTPRWPAPCWPTRSWRRRNRDAER